MGVESEESRPLDDTHCRSQNYIPVDEDDPLDELQMSQSSRRALEDWNPLEADHRRNT